MADNSPEMFMFLFPAAKQQAVVNKLDEAKEARVTLNKMRREHQDKVKQMEQEQSMLARMQMEQKLALLRQQKQEQMEFQESLQKKRLEVLHSQRAEYEQKVTMQRELERQHLIAQEQKVIEHQFGRSGGSTVGASSQTNGQPPLQSVAPQQFQNILQSNDLQSLPANHIPLMVPPGSNLSVSDPSALPMQSLSVQEQAAPLPTKLTYNTEISGANVPQSLDSIGPPPYDPGNKAGIGATPYLIKDPLPGAEYSTHHSQYHYQMVQQPGALPTQQQAPQLTQQPPAASVGVQVSQSGSQHSLGMPPSGYSPIPLSRSYELSMQSNMQLPGMQPQSMQPQSMQPQSMQPQSMQPQSMQPPNIQPQSMQPQSMQPQSMQPQSMQPPSMQPPSMQPPSMQPPSMQPPSMQPPSMQPPSMQPPSMQPVGYAPVPSGGIGQQQVSVSYSTDNVQQPQFSQGAEQISSNHGNSFTSYQPQQFQDPSPPSTLQSASSPQLLGGHSTGSVHNMGQLSSYQVQQQPQQQQQQQQSVPNGYTRRESEPPLISFD